MARHRLPQSSATEPDATMAVDPDDIKKECDKHFGPPPSEVPAASPVAVAFPFPVSLTDVQSMYNVALNYTHKAMTTGLSSEAAAMMAKNVLDTIRVAAGLEALINLHRQ